MEFQMFPKMARLSREVIITEKIDGTNAQICIVALDGYPAESPVIAEADGLAMYAGSRKRWITPERDNFGFARWVKDNAETLFALGEGRHFGEWWGSGIQRGYGLTGGEKRFGLFNVSRWGDERPECCEVVPVLYRGLFDSAEVERCLTHLAFSGSKAAPGFMRPEGVVVYHVAAGVGFKKTIEKDDQPKGIN